MKTLTAVLAAALSALAVVHAQDSIARIIFDPVQKATGQPMVKGPKEFEVYIAHDRAQWKPVIQHNNIRLD